MNLNPLKKLQQGRLSDQRNGNVLFSAVKPTRSIKFLRLCVLLFVLVSLIVTPFQLSARAQAGWQWYQTDPHVHSSVSADAFVDIGIHSYLAQQSGYDAVF